MNLFAIPPAITFFLVVFLGGVVYLKNRTDKRAKLLALSCLSLSVWLFFFALMYLSKDPTTALLFARVGFIGVAFIPVCMYHFVLTLTGKKESFLTLLLYVLSFLAILLSQSKLIYKSVELHFWGFYPVAGPFYIYFVLQFTIFFALSTYLLYQQIQEEKEKHHWNSYNQIKLVFLGYLVASLGLADYLPKFGIEIYPYGYLPALVFFSCMGYAIVAHRLMDIEFVIWKHLVPLVVLPVVVMGTLAVCLVLPLVFPAFPPFSVVHLLVIGLTTIFTFSLANTSALKEGVRTLADRLFYKGRYQLAKALHTFALTIPHREKKIVPLTTQVTQTISNILEVKAQLYLSREILSRFHSEGRTPPDACLQVIDNATLLNYLQETKSPLFVDDIPTAKIPEKLTLKHETLSEAHVLIPVHDAEQVVGWLALSEKASHKMFTSDEVVALCQIASQIALALRVFVKQAEEEEQSHLFRSQNTELQIYFYEIRKSLLIIQDGVKRLANPHPKEDDEEALLTTFLQQDIATLNQQMNSFKRYLPISAVQFERVSVQKLLETAFERTVSHQLGCLKVQFFLTEPVPEVMADPHLMTAVFQNIFIYCADQLVEGTLSIRLSASCTCGKKRENSAADTGWIHLEISDPQGKVNMAVFNDFYLDKLEWNFTKIRRVITQKHWGHLEVFEEPGSSPVLLIHLPLEQLDINAALKALFSRRG